MHNPWPCLLGVISLLQSTGVFAEQKQCSKEVCTIKVNEPDGRVSVWVEALLPVQTNVVVKFEASVPVDRTSPVSLTLKGNDRKRVFVTKKAATSGLNIHFEAASFLGNPAAVPDPKALYCLPFAKNSTYEVIESYGGETHQGEDRYSVDFALPEGTPIQAAREGTVVDQEVGVTTHGQSEADAVNANYIKIVHRDGTLAVYAHLENQGSVVKVGDHVMSGQIIGYSGNTGFSTGPHLHFEVLVPAMNGHRSVPVTFTSSKGPISNPKERQSYTSVCGAEVDAKVQNQTSYRQAVLKIMNEYSPAAFQNCYVPYLNQFRKGIGPEPKQGELELSVEIGSTGTVKSVKTVKNKELPESIETCVSEGLLRLKFKPSSLRSIVVPYAVTFKFH